MPDRQVAQTLQRGIAVLRELNERNGSTASEIAVRTGLNDVVVRRLLDTLVAEQVAIKTSASGQYWLTVGACALSIGYIEDRWIVEVAEPRMKELGQQVIWPVSLLTLSGISLVVRTNTDQISPLTIRKAPIGQKFPLSKSASGPVYLAFCDPKEKEGLINLLWQTQREEFRYLSQSKHGMAAYLAAIRRRGYCIYNGDARVSALAVPVHDGQRAYAALTLRYFTSAISAKDAAARYAPALKACAAEIVRQSKERRLFELATPNRGAL